MYKILNVCTGKNVAIKVQNLKEISTEEKDINEEYRILRDLSSHPNLPDFYGAFTKKSGSELWFVIEVCHLFLWYFSTFTNSRQKKNFLVLLLLLSKLVVETGKVFFKHFSTWLFNSTYFRKYNFLCIK